MATPKTPKLTDKELAANYGWALATMNSVPDLKALFKKAVEKQYTPERFVAEMRNTQWYQTTNEAQRKYLVLKTADPAAYVAQVKQIMASLSDQYSQMTGEILPMGEPRLSGGQILPGTGFLFTAANQALQLGLNESQIKDQLFSAVDWKQKIQTDSLGGQASGDVQAMRQQAAAYGVTPTEDWYADQIDKIVSGEDTAEGSLGRIKELAKQRYSAFADQIDGGRTVADLSEGYRQSMARVLELNPAQIDVFDPKLQSALTNRTTEGADAPLSISQFEDSLRKDDRWQYTKNAKETLVGTGQNVLRSFGLVT